MPTEYQSEGQDNNDDMTVGPMLTLIPESERTIDHRLQIIFVGKGARVLADRIVSSELNEFYRPRKKDRSPKKMALPDSSGDAAPLLGVTPAEEDDFVFFCPVEHYSSSLARVRLQIVEGFSACIPTVSNEIAAREQCVVLLHWRDDERGVESVDETLREFNMRAAEMNHSMRCLPLVFLLSINEGYSDHERLEEALANRAFKDGKTAQIMMVQDGTEACLFEAIQDLVGIVINAKMKTPQTYGIRRKVSSLIEEQKSRCCTVS